MEKILDENYYDFIINNTLALQSEGESITVLNERHSMLHVPVNIFNMCDLGMYPYNRFPTLFTLLSQLSLDSSNISQIQANPSLALFGTGVLIGIIDTGVDYTHPAFKRSDNTSRIVSIWDQTIQSGYPPEGFTYGTEYDNQILNLALRTEEPFTIVPSTDTNGHGTAIASIVAGSPDPENSFTGVVPQSQLVVVKLKEAKQNLRRIFSVPEDVVCFQETDIILGIRYVLSVAQRLGRPIVILIAVGSSMSGHEGVGATSSYIDFLSQLSHVNVVVSAGNEGNKNRHFYGNVRAAPYVQEFELKISSNDPFFSFQIWPDIQARLAVQIIAPTGEMTSLIYPSIGTCVNHQFVFSQTEMWVNNILLEEENGSQLILIRFVNASEGIWRVRVNGIDQAPFSYNSWLPSGDMISNETFFLLSTPDTTITAPGNADHVLTVTAYDQVTGSIIIDSSRGYTRGGRVKPDVAAPGSMVPCAVPGGGYASLTGTGAAAAHASGAVAMVFEWAVVRGNYTSLTGKDVNSLIIRGATRNPIYAYPNNIWGYGKLNMYALFELLTFI
ncbi:S8 family peptidase [Faecalicatena contorta]|uniref:Subtilase family protein n=1 Tax=Faecalicatena contorta TaxID=39482 RepID=A0A315ZYB5_9FIRM|nr:S8 family peptidase [Faecalicatena contorta]PWJ49514.1 subtilase family protein [Faecalicatena contorta]SUQ14758.1 Subtilase family protein [Faecalicatena contorta]